MDVGTLTVRRPADTLNRNILPPSYRMSVDAPPRTLNVALVGNPNTGKSTLFHGLSGVRQKTGNYPGVTVEKKHGTFVHDGQKVTLIDLPGTYSLAPPLAR